MDRREFIRTTALAIPAISLLPVPLTWTAQVKFQAKHADPYQTMEMRQRSDGGMFFATTVQTEVPDYMWDQLLKAQRWPEKPFTADEFWEAVADAKKNYGVFD